MSVLLPTPLLPFPIHLIFHISHISAADNYFSIFSRYSWLIRVFVRFSFQFCTTFSFRCQSSKTHSWKLILILFTNSQFFDSANNPEVEYILECKLNFIHYLPLHIPHFHQIMGFLLCPNNYSLKTFFFQSVYFQVSFHPFLLKLHPTLFFQHFIFFQYLFQNLSFVLVF